MRDFSPTIEREVSSLVKGECFFDGMSRERYSTAACWYKILPVGVVCPKDASDVQAVVRYCFQNDIPLIPRGAATGMAGQAVGLGIILDLTRHMNRIKAADHDTVLCEPGVVLAQLNESLRQNGQYFPIDPASHALCTIGGIVATNAAGSHGIKYGSTKDYLEELTVVLSNGEITTIGAQSIPNPSQPPFFAGMVRALDPLLQSKKGLIRKHFPIVAKNSSGYNLKDAVQLTPTDFRKIIAGSEGTLAVVTEAKLKIASPPAGRAGALAYFSTYEKTVDAVMLGLEIEPAAIEILDHTYVTLAKGLGSETDALIEDRAKAMLYFEFEGNIPEMLQRNIMRLNRSISLCSPIRFLPLTSESELNNIWRLREEASRVMNFVKSNGKTTFVEDVAVQPHQLALYVKGLRDILSKYNIGFSLYGHAGVGNIHCATFVDLKNLEHYKVIDTIASEVCELVISLGGTLSGEHGDGYIRTPFLERLYGTDVYELFRRVKQAFDPKNILNPGKIIGTQTATILHDLDLS